MHLKCLSTLRILAHFQLLNFATFLSTLRTLATLSTCKLSQRLSTLRILVHFELANFPALLCGRNERGHDVRKALLIGAGARLSSDHFNKFDDTGLETAILWCLELNSDIRCADVHNVYANATRHQCLVDGPDD